MLGRVGRWLLRHADRERFVTALQVAACSSTHLCREDCIHDGNVLRRHIRRCRQAQQPRRLLPPLRRWRRAAAAAAQHCARCCCRSPLHAVHEAQRAAQGGTQLAAATAAAAIWRRRGCHCLLQPQQHSWRRWPGINCGSCCWHA